jgi:hypothetical protein
VDKSADQVEMIAGQRQTHRPRWAQAYNCRLALLAVEGLPCLHMTARIHTGLYRPTTYLLTPVRLPPVAEMGPTGGTNASRGVKAGKGEDVEGARPCSRYTRMEQTAHQESTTASTHASMMPDKVVHQRRQRFSAPVACSTVVKRHDSPLPPGRHSSAPGCPSGWRECWGPEAHMVGKTYRQTHVCARTCSFTKSNMFPATRQAAQATCTGHKPATRQLPMTPAPPMCSPCHPRSLHLAAPWAPRLAPSAGCPQPGAGRGARRAR